MGRKPVLTAEEAAHVREMYKNPALKESVYTLAHLFRVSAGTIDAILERKKPYNKKTETYG